MRYQTQRFCVDYGTNDMRVRIFRDVAFFCQFAWFTSRKSFISKKWQTLDVVYILSPLPPPPRRILSLFANPQWAILMPPTKSPMSVEEKMWSEMLESVRKDVECFFGILKGRFRVLKLPIPYRSKENIDNMFFTCCTLHNMLHAFDGMDVFEENVNWDQLDGLFDSYERPPSTDESWVGSMDTQEHVEVELGHDVLKEKLIAHFAYRKQRKDIVWLQR